MAQLILVPINELFFFLFICENRMHGQKIATLNRRSPIGGFAYGIPLNE